jgi:hypothetical protein
MTPPAVAAQRLGISFVMGLVLGVLYGFLRPVRIKHRHLGDLIFVIATAIVWVYQSFAVCRGDLRPGYWAGLAAGCIIWELTAGRLLRPVFSFFWKWFDRIFGFPFRLLRKIFIKIIRFLKNVFASAKKWVTINRIKKAGTKPDRKGVRHGKRQKRIQPDTAGVQAQQQCDQNRGSVRYRVVYGDAPDSG